MAVTLSYGNYQHADNEVNVNVSRRGLENQTGYVFGYVEVWTITGIMQADSLAALKTAMGSLETAYREPNKDLIWKIGDTVNRCYRNLSRGTGSH
jgi:hypothetical protein